jgi:hypothetical protein
MSYLNSFHGRVLVVEDNVQTTDYLAYTWRVLTTMTSLFLTWLYRVLMVFLCVKKFGTTIKKIFQF